MPADDPLSLAAEFPAATYDQWRRLVEPVLRGAAFETLSTRTADGLIIAPLYARATAAATIAPRAATRWQVMARIDHPDPAAANAQALADLAGGATGLVLVGAGAVGAHGYGLPGDAIERVLDGIQLDAGIAIELAPGPQTGDWPRALATFVERRGLAPATLGIRFGVDPLGAAAIHGGFARPWSELAPLSVKLAAELAAQGFTRAIVAADGRVVHDAGGSEAQELAFVIAAAVAWLRAFEASGIALAQAQRMIAFRLAADADQFLTIAKFRALRMLWRRVEESCGLVPEAAFVGAETAWRTMTRNDPHVNILRATIGVAAAGFGGADAITVLPFTAARGLPDAFARRIARNTQLVLLDEAGLGRVADPSAGTGWSEDLTDKLARAAWSLVQEIEAAGGAAAALERGLIQEKAAAARAARERALADRVEALVGADAFPPSEALPVAVLDMAPVAAEPPPVAVPVRKLTPVRFAQPFEPPQ